jgi:hypothetical protein
MVGLSSQRSFVQNCAVQETSIYPAVCFATDICVANTLLIAFGIVLGVRIRQTQDDLAVKRECLQGDVEAVAIRAHEGGARRNSGWTDRQSHTGISAGAGFAAGSLHDRQPLLWSIEDFIAMRDMSGKQAKTPSDDNVKDLLIYAECARHPVRNQIIVLLSAKAGLRAGEMVE